MVWRQLELNSWQCRVCTNISSICFHFCRVVLSIRRFFFLFFYNDFRNEQIRKRFLSLNSEWKFYLLSDFISNAGYLWLTVFETVINNRDENCNSACECRPQSACGDKRYRHDPNESSALSQSFDLFGLIADLWDRKNVVIYRRNLHQIAILHTTWFLN